MNKKKAGILMCTHFNCDHRRGNYCCFQCQKIGTCKNPCYNSPLKCGEVMSSACIESVMAQAAAALKEYACNGGAYDA